MINAKTKVCAIIGHPVEHSMSPTIHNAAFQQLGLNYVYVAFDVVNVKAAIEAMRALDFRGYSVTIPHKVEVMKYLDRVDKLAAKIQAVNTVVNNNGLLTGYNTDVIGAIKSLKRRTELKGKKTALVGAGGAGRAIAFGLMEEKATLTIFDKDFEKARKLAKSVGCSYNPMEKIDSSFDILINATPVGMHPKTNQMAVDEKILKPGMLVFDIVYNPIKTKLVETAEAKGCETISGIEMLIEQGAEQFRLWTGQEAPRELMKGVLLKELQK